MVVSYDSLRIRKKKRVLDVTYAWFEQLICQLGRSMDMFCMYSNGVTRGANVARAQDTMARVSYLKGHDSYAQYLSTLFFFLCLLRVN